jgi:hypothetical protein
MAEQAPVSDDVTPTQFFQELLPMGFAAQQQAGEARPGDITLQYRLAGDGGGTWVVEIRDGRMHSRQGEAEAHLVFTLSVDQWREAVLGRNGAALPLILPAQRPGRPDNSGRAKALKGTLALELGREGEPFKVELSFNGAPAPRTVMKMKLADYLDMQTGKLNGQEAFMTGKLRVEGDMAFLMQVAALTA